MRTQGQGDHLQARKKVLARNWISQHLDLELPNIQNYEKNTFPSFKTPCLWHFIRAGWANQDGPKDSGDQLKIPIPSLPSLENKWIETKQSPVELKGALTVSQENSVSWTNVHFQIHSWSWHLRFQGWHGPFQLEFHFEISLTLW